MLWLDLSVMRMLSSRWVQRSSIRLKLSALRKSWPGVLQTLKHVAASTFYVLDRFKDTDLGFLLQVRAALS